MSKYDPIIERIFRMEHAQRRLRLSDIVLKVAQEMLGYSSPDAEQYADRSTRRIWNYVVQRIDEEEKKCLSPTFQIVDSNRYELLWHPYLTDDDDPRNKEKKLRLAHRGRILNFLDDSTSIGSREYEALGCVISILSGATQWHLTPPGNEFGIDFVAVIPSYGRCHLFPSLDNTIRLVGQSKKWNTKVERKDVEYLASRLDLIRCRNQDILSILPSWFISSGGLTLGVMLSHSGVQSGGEVVARDQGIILSDRRDIAEIVALSRQWGVSRTSADVIEFLRQLVDLVISR